MTKPEIKNALISIIIGACTIFLVSLLEGLLDFLKNHGAEIVGSGVAAWKYALSSKA
jgi:hypothetical protein